MAIDLFFLSKDDKEWLYSFCVYQKTKNKKTINDLQMTNMLNSSFETLVKCEEVE